MKSLVAASTACVVLAASAAQADDQKRTADLHWTLDDRLNLGDGTKPGVVLQGDKLTVSVDTNQRFASSTTADNGQPFFGHSHTSLSLDTAANSGASETGNVATFKTTSAHGLAVGDVIVVSNVGVAGYNGTYTVETVPGTTSFTVTLSATGLAASGGGTVDAPEVVDMPIGLKDFTFASTGNGFVLDDGQCLEGTKVSRTAGAVDCAVQPEKRKDPNWPRPEGGNPPTQPPVWTCSSSKAFVGAGASRAVHLMKPVAPPAAPAGAKAKIQYQCVSSWVLRADDDFAVDSVTVTLGVGTGKTVLAGTLTDGVWAAETALKDAGHAYVTVAIKYHNGFTNATKLAAFDIQTVDDHSLIRIQPELMASKNLRSVNVGVAITPVGKEFFKSGPWHNCSSHLCIMNGLNPSAIARFTGDNTLLQFGVGLSLFFNQSMLVNAGLLFGSENSSQYWSAPPNFFVGFAIDPALLTEARAAGK